MPGTTISLLLLNDDGQGLRTASISNWNGKAIAAPKTELPALLKRPELEHAGIYLLLGMDPSTNTPTVYVGEAEVVRDRLKQHATKEWSQVIVFVSEALQKSYTRYLEGRLIKIAEESGRCVMHNAVASGAKLPEHQREEMEGFLFRIRQLLPVLGCHIFVKANTIISPQTNLVCRIKELTARGRRTANGFIVYKDSEASATLRKSAEEAAPWLVNLRGSLVKTGVLTKKGDRLLFAQDYEFTSPSAAAAIVRGGNANGLTEWRNEDGKKLRDIEAAL